MRGQTVTTQQHIRIDIPQGVLNGRTTAGQTTSDQTLIERIAAGDKLAMRVLFARHHVRVYRFVVRLVRDETLAEDVVGEMAPGGNLQGARGRLNLAARDRALQGAVVAAAQRRRGAGRGDRARDRGPGRRPGSGSAEEGAQ